MSGDSIAEVEASSWVLAEDFKTVRSAVSGYLGGLHWAEFGMFALVGGLHTHP